MGNLCGRPPPIVKDCEESPKQRRVVKVSSELNVPRTISSRRDESFRVKKKFHSGEIKIQLVDKKVNGSRRVRDDYYVKNTDNFGVDVNNYPGAGSVPKAIEGEQIAAGWPAWLASAAGEAIKGWLPRKADTFEKLDKIGQGTYSSVYKARDLLHNKVFALKRVRFDNMDPQSVKFMAREILILRRLDHPNIIKLEGLVTSKSSSSLYLVFEYMEHDLTGLASLPGTEFTEPQVKCYMQQLLSGLDHCHTRGVLHRDIKGSNLLIDNHGILKIADFGLATFFDCNQSIPLTSRVVTLWYRPPELLLGTSHYGVSVDLWSTGCILGELYVGKPIMTGRTEVEQLHKIFKLCGSPSEDYWRKAKLPNSTVFKPLQPYKRRLVDTFKDLPTPAVGLIDTLLSVDPECRGTAAAALRSKFFNTEPFACSPSNLPRYPPSKEIDAKLREEEAKRQGALGVKGQGSERERRVSKDMIGISVLDDTDAQLASSTQRRPGQSNSKSQIEQFNPHKDEIASAFPVDAPKRSQGVKDTSEASSERPSQRISCSGPLGPGPGVGWALSTKKYDDTSFVPTRPQLSTLSGLVASRTVPSEESRNKHGYSQFKKAKQVENSELLEECTKMQDNNFRIQSSSSSRHLETGKVIMKGTVQHDRGGRGSNKIHFSGPLHVPSNKVEQMLKEHERQVQEAARRARIEKARVGKVQTEGVQITANPVYASPYGSR